MPHKLHGGSTHCPRGSIDEHALSTADTASSEEVQGQQAAVGNGRGFRIAQIEWFSGQDTAFGHALALGVGAKSETVEAEHLLTLAE